MNSKPVGPIDLKKALAKVKSGEVAVRTRTVTVYLDLEAAARLDEVAEKHSNAKFRHELAEGPRNAQSITEPSADRDLLADLEREYDELEAKLEASAVDITFRDSEIGDASEITEKMHADKRPETNEWFVAYSLAQYAVDPVLTVEEVLNLPKLIGPAQMRKLQEAYQSLLGGAPLSPKPLLGRVTPTS